MIGEVMAHQVRDSGRTLQFEGDRLSHSSSRRQNSTRWVEMDLYRTAAGQYVLSKVAVSLLYHLGTCAVVNEHHLRPVAAATLVFDAVPCERCDPSGVEDNAQVYPEIDVYRAQVCVDAADVVAALERRDPNSKQIYLTRVAQALLEEAALSDPVISKSMPIQIIP